VSLSAVVTNIARGSLHDGPGVRTVVYLKGCPLHCPWCHNPETLSSHPQMLYAPVKCIGCGRCLTVCGNHTIVEGKHVFLRQSCKNCGRCAQVCPSGALELCGQTMTVEQVWAVVEKDRHYYRQSGGGLTLSGGECLARPEFSAALLERCRREGIHTAIESAFSLPWENAAAVLPWVNLVYADLKHHDKNRHKMTIGQSNEPIIANLTRASHMAEEMIVRIPLIPNFNDSEEDMAAFGEILAGFAPKTRFELLKYNTLAGSKYRLLDREEPDYGDQTQSDERVMALAAILSEKSGRKCENSY